MSDRIHVATRKGIFTIDRTGNATVPWRIGRASFVGDKCVLTGVDGRDRALYACLDHGHFGSKLHRSEDGGATWTEIGVPSYPEMPEGYEPKPHPMSGKPMAWKLKMMWALEPGGPDETGVLWCGTLPGGLFRSPDRGATWEIVRPLWDRPEREGWFGGGYDEPGIHSICVDPRDPAHVIVGISCGGAWRTEDGGATWSNCAQGMRAEYMPPEQAYDVNIQDPHIVVRCPSHPDVLWSQHHNGIFRTIDNAASWTELENVAPSAFGFAAAVHPDEPDTAWFVPAIKDEKRVPVDGAVVVTRTRDGGRTFESLRAGLPQEHAYDLVYRHALDIDESGDRLAMGSTTGSVWVSEDQGDSWMLVSSHLPPVHAVRFG